MFKAWNIADSLLTNWTTGHQFWEPTIIAAELRRRGKLVRLLGHQTIQAKDFPDAATVPFFPYSYAERISEDPVWGTVERFIVHNRSIHRTLAKADRALFENSVTLFPNLSERQLLGVFRWLERYPVETRPKTVLVLSALRDWSEADQSVGFLKKIWEGCPPDLKREIPLCVRTEISARKFQDVLGIRAHVLPSPLGPTEDEIERAASWRGSPDASVTVAFLAGARQERGAVLLPEVVNLCNVPGVKFFIQVNESHSLGLGANALKALRYSSNAILHEGTLARADYLGRIAQSVIFLPYDRDAYRWRSSGVYLEAKALGAPVIVPSGTWMADDVKICGNGVVFEDYSAQAIARCIAAACADIANLRARAAAAAVEFRKQHGAARFIDMVENLARSR